MFNMFKSTAALVLLLGAVSSLPAPPPASVIDNTFFIFGPPPGWGKGPDVEGRGRFGCDNPHPYCKKDNHPKEACTDWGEAWKEWMEENCLEKCGKCGGGGGGPPPPPGPSAPGRRSGRGKCEDKKAECGGWGDHCVGGDYENWMKDNCPKTCGTCDDGTGSCEDKKTECGGWAGHCVGGKYENWMKEHCPKTCGHCDGGTEPT